MLAVAAFVGCAVARAPKPVGTPSPAPNTSSAPALLQIAGAPTTSPFSDGGGRELTLAEARRIYAHRIAVTIGIEKYRSPIPPLKAAVRDAKRMATLFKQLGFDRVEKLEDDQATRARVLNLLEDDIVPLTGPNDLLLVFFSGHGVTHENMGFILPYDATSAVETTGISMQRIKEAALRIPAKHVVYLVDACFSGAMLHRLAGPVPGNPQGYWEQVTSQRIVQVLAAGEADEKSLEKGEWGLFTHALYDGLTGSAFRNGSSVMSLSELAAYVEKRVKTESGSRQHPIWGNVEGHASAVFWRPDRSTRDILPGPIEHEAVNGFEAELEKSHALIERQEWSQALDLTRNLALRQDNAEFNLLLAEIYLRQDALSNNKVILDELARVERLPTTANQRRRALDIRAACELARQGRY